MKDLFETMVCGSIEFLKFMIFVVLVTIIGIPIILGPLYISEYTHNYNWLWLYIIHAICMIYAMGSDPSCRRY